MTDKNEPLKEKEDMETQAIERAVAETKESLNFWQEVWLQARLAWRLLTDSEVPLYLKVIPAISLIYLVSPLDFLPDAILGLGQLDDLTALLIGAKVFIEMVPPHIVARHRQDLTAEMGWQWPVEDEATHEIDADVADSIVIEGDFNKVEKE